jgi:ketosteroid isomerase-like protein
MAQDMTEVIRSGLGGWSRGDLEQAMEGLAPDIEFVTSGAFPGLDPVYRGHEGIMRFFTDFREAWEDITIDIERIVEGPSPFYVMVGKFRATAREGLAVERPVTLLVTASGGKIQRMESFASREEAFAAAGIPA